MRQRSGRGASRRRPYLATLCAVLLAAALALPPPAAAMNDDEIRGYAVAVVQREFRLRPEAVTVSDGVIHIEAELSDSDRERLQQILGDVEGVRGVEISPGATAYRGGWAWLPLR